ncbi:hypothetical protein BDV95DRAFT_7802 [Massariosphaeria phaeospora]|uniref:Uncharacterized protein n=1 Tax=Massariosphaeria phaeospora TaxID=100035 RepID=A0A7C8MJQ5_9PLEO|nr:hypothetical protein BDV95DRAFT_7802 [Massariosphaeria phaeospora]
MGWRGQRGRVRWARVGARRRRWRYLRLLRLWVNIFLDHYHTANIPFSTLAIDIFPNNQTANIFPTLVNSNSANSNPTIAVLSPPNTNNLSPFPLHPSRLLPLPTLTPTLKPHSRNSSPLPLRPYLPPHPLLRALHIPQHHLSHQHNHDLPLHHRHPPHHAQTLLHALHHLRPS